MMESIIIIITTGILLFLSYKFLFFKRMLSLLNTALPVLKEIAKITPTQVDDKALEALSKILAYIEGTGKEPPKDRP